MRAPPSPPSPPPSPRFPPSLQPPVGIAAVYLAQTHVLEVGEYVNSAFKLVAGRPALLKVQLTGDGSSPVVRAIVTAKTGESTLLLLTGPRFLPSLWNGTPGQVEHKLEDSFTATIPAEWVSHGMAIELYADVESLARYELSVGAPSAMKMLMFDVYYFGTGNGDVRPRLYPKPILALLPAIFTMRYTLHHAVPEWLGSGAGFQVAGRELHGAADPRPSV